MKVYANIFKSNIYKCIEVQFGVRFSNKLTTYARPVNGNVNNEDDPHMSMKKTVFVSHTTAKGIMLSFLCDKQILLKSE